MTLEAGAAQTSTVTVGGAYDGKIAGLYDLEETLGSGHFAVVKLARHVFTGAKVAVKVVDKTKLDEVSKAHLFQEVRCMKLVQHPNVVRLYEVIDTQTKLYLVLELADGGDLYDYIMKHESGLNEDLARKYFRQILRAITYCHELHVVHRDLKPENVVFFEKLDLVKLTDFGFSNKFLPGQKLETFCGSLAYSAPEILLGDSYDAPAVDIWSLGVILYMLVCGQPPFEKANDSETLTMIMDCKYTLPSHVSQNCRNLISTMLVRDPKKRANLEQIANDAWLQESDVLDSVSSVHFLPLVSCHQLSEEDHAFIIQKMINGNIAPKEEIMQALDQNKYNHITATYFLLTEMRLRKRREEQAQKQRLLDQASSSSSADSNKKRSQAKQSESAKVIVPISISIANPPQLVLEGKTDKRSRKCSIVREEDEEESANENSDIGNELKVAVTRRESISDGRLNRVQEQTQQRTPDMPTHARTKIVVSMDSTLAEKLNKMDKHEIVEKEDDDALRGLKELEIGKLKPLPNTSKNPVLTHRRTKINKIRTPSCSSSEASDDDTKTRNKKKMNKFVGDTPTRFRTYRRDSHDDSSDSQSDQLHPGARSQGNTSNLISNSGSTVSGNNDGQCKEPSKTEETRKSHTQKSKKQQSKEHHIDRQRDKPLLPVENLSRRQRIRESQSLDRITEAFESSHLEQRNSLFNLNTFSVAEINEEYDEDIVFAVANKNDHTNGCTTNHNIKVNLVGKATLRLHSSKNYKNNNKRTNKTPNNLYNLKSIEEIDLILEDKSLTKAIQNTGSKCFVTMKKIRRLGKYFPVVNFS